MNFRELEKNITDSISESILKLGYELLPITLYFPADALCLLLGEDVSRDMLMPIMQMFCRQAETRLGMLKVEIARDGRYAVTIPAEGVKYVYEHSERADFTSALVHLMEEPDTDIMEIVSLFRANGNVCVCRTTDCDDMDYVLYFRDGKPDEYR